MSRKQEKKGGQGRNHQSGQGRGNWDFRPIILYIDVEEDDVFFCDADGNRRGRIDLGETYKIHEGSRNSGQFRVEEVDGRIVVTTMKKSLFEVRKDGILSVSDEGARPWTPRSQWQERRDHRDQRHSDDFDGVEEDQKSSKPKKSGGRGKSGKPGEVKAEESSDSSAASSDEEKVA